MGRVIANASMSLDRYIAKHDKTIGRLFDWLHNGEVEIPTATPAITVHLTPQSAEHWRRWTAQLRALVCGRTLFDFTDGWGGRHTMDVPVVVVTHEAPTEWVEAHPDAPFTFVADGVAAAVAEAQRIAGDRRLAVPAGDTPPPRPGPGPSPGSAWSWGCSTRWPSTWCRSSWGRAGPSSARCPRRTSRSGTRPSASWSTASPTWCSPWCADPRRPSEHRRHGRRRAVGPHDEPGPAGPGLQPAGGVGPLRVGGGGVDVGPGERARHHGDRGDAGGRAAGARVDQVLPAVRRARGRHRAGEHRDDGQDPEGIGGVLDPDPP